MKFDRPLLLMSDEVLLDETLRIADSAGCITQRAADATSLPNQWQGASVVVLDKNSLLNTSGLRRRSHIVLILRKIPQDEIWLRASDLGIDHIIFLPEQEFILRSIFVRAVHKTRRANAEVTSE